MEEEEGVQAVEAGDVGFTAFMIRYLFVLTVIALFFIVDDRRRRRQRKIGFNFMMFFEDTAIANLNEDHPRSFPLL